MAVEKTVDFGDISIAYETDGPWEGEPIFLLHGFPDTPRTWDGVVDALKDLGLFIVRPSIRGHGATRLKDEQGVSAETSALADDVRRLADYLEIDQFTIVGSDWGCRAAYAFAALWPERIHGMVTLGTGYNEATPITDLSMQQVSSFWYQWIFNTEHGRPLLTAETKEFCRHLWRTWSPSWDFTEDEFERAAVYFENPQFVDTVLHYYRYRWGSDPISPKYRKMQRIVESMPAIEVPTTHIQGLEDYCTRPETATRWETRVTSSYRRIDLPGIGHFPQREVPDQVAAAIRDVLSRQNRIQVPA